MRALPRKRAGERPGGAQGLVLGLTIAETMVLMIFVLLLAMTVLLAREGEDRRAAEQASEDHAQILRELAESNMEVGELIELMAAGGPGVLSDAETWRELVRDLGAADSASSRGEVRDQVWEELERATLQAEIDSALVEAGLEPSQDILGTFAELAKSVAGESLGPKGVRRAIAGYRALRGALSGEGFSEEAAGLATMSEMEVTEEVSSLVADAARWRERLEAEGDGTGPGGSGSDNPSCWYDRDGTVAYLYDVALTDQGFILEAGQAPQHADKRDHLPLEGVQTGVTLSPGRFLAQTRSVYRWSVDNDCRFFVRAFDMTGPNEKELYKVRMETLEGHFYKNASPSGPSPF